MYKVFFNDSTIQIASEYNKSSKNNIRKIVESSDYDAVSQILFEIESSSDPLNFLIQNQDVNQTWKYFKKCFKKIPAAGGLVQNRDGSFLFIRRFGLWDLPKGKIEKNETAETAALREVEEECGLSELTIVKQLDSTFHIYRSPYLSFQENLVLKETKWFFMNYSGNEVPQPQLEEKIEEVKWFSLAELVQVKANTYSSLNDFLEKSLPVI
jgi:8-oxo-dGTP pyrophosphatase MutT (NUDIX family)